MSEALSAVWGAGEPGRPALVVPEEGASLTFAELARRVDELAGRLRALGVEQGDRVAIALPNGPEIVQLVLAAAAVGAAAAPLNPAYTTDEFAFYLDDLAPRVLLLPAGELAAARAATAGTETVGVGSDATGRIRLRSGRGEPAPAAFPSGGPEDVAILLHTSGTTSRPKQVPLLQRNLVASARSIAAHYRLGPDDVSYVAMPLSRIHGLVASTHGTIAAVAGSGVSRWSPQATSSL